MSESALSLGIDLGTGSVKAVLLDPAGAQVGAASAQVGLHEPQPGWVESDPEEWWAALVSAVQKALGGRTSGVAAIGLSGQMHGVVLCGRRADALRRAVVSLDRRAVPDLDAYRALPPKLLSRLGNPLVPGTAGPILHWLARHETALLKKATWALQPKDWLRLRLTSEAGSEPSDASGTLLFDLVGNTWAWEVADALGVPAKLLAPLGEAARAAGLLREAAASSLGLQKGTPVAYGAADTAAALVGTALPRGAVQLTIGSAAQVVAFRESPVPDPGLRYHVFCSAQPRLWYALAAVQVAGVALEWVLKVFGCHWGEAYRCFDLSPPGARGVVFVPHLAGARSPRMDSNATGGFSGFQLAHGRADLLRAAFEGVAFSIAEAAAALPEMADASSVYLAGGGTLHPSWRQLLSDALGKTLLVIGDPNASARGAALLGWQAAGHDCRSLSSPDVTGRVEPDEAVHRHLAAAFDRWKEAATIMSAFYPRGEATTALLSAKFPHAAE
jgi:xylulokinase